MYIFCQPGEVLSGLDLECCESFKGEKEVTINTFSAVCRRFLVSTIKASLEMRNALGDKQKSCGAFIILQLLPIRIE